LSILPFSTEGILIDVVPVKCQDLTLWTTLLGILAMGLKRISPSSPIWISLGMGFKVEANKWKGNKLTSAPVH